MFTGLIQGLGTVADVSRRPDGVRLAVSSQLAARLREGDSVAVDGVCLTATEVQRARFGADVMNETLGRTSLADVQPGAQLNLELPLRAGDPLGGHIVQGHVDGLGRLADTVQDGFARRLRIDAEAEVLRYVVVKGSITVNGVSLTVAETDDRSFTVSLIPETLQRTNLAAVEPGARVNLEVDVLAKYVEKLTVAQR